jgi:SHAQKYF class myb-like DNA-binding protein
MASPNEAEATVSAENQEHNEEYPTRSNGRDHGTSRGKDILHYQYQQPPNVGYSEQRQHHFEMPAAPASASTRASTSAATASAVSHSVVPDLMRVYESMTQSKTPDNPYNANIRHQPKHSYSHTQAHEHLAHHYHTNWTYDITSIPIPKPPVYPMGPVEPAETRAEATSRSGRPMRKRNVPSKDYAEMDASSTSSVGSSNKSRRKNSSKNKKKDKANDGRWSKRFTWPEELHRDFVSAIFDVGLKHSSPSTVLEHMPQHEQITTERIKSHLQKYRMHRQKSKKEFMTSYAATLQKLNKEGTQGITTLAGGEVAAHLTHAAMTQPDPENNVDDDSSPTAPQNSQGKRSSSTTSQEAHSETQEILVLPRLTETEKQSPIGASLGYLLGLFFSLKLQLDRQREYKQQQEAAAAKQQAQQQEQHAAVAVYDSFVGEQVPHVGDVPVVSTTASSTVPAAAAVHPSTRSNLEENNMMKREMQNQMAVQNRLRALKQQELNKYHNITAAHVSQSQHHHDDAEKPSAHEHPVSMEQTATDSPPLDPQQQNQQLQGAGEPAAGADASRERNQSMSLEDEEFWNTDVVDEQLFQFLMNN